MTVKELKERLKVYPDEASVTVLNTMTGLAENAQLPHASDDDDTLIVHFEPEGWH
jgi:hypothetical protein